MATIAYQSSLVTGLPQLNMVAASAGGDKVLPNDRGIVVFRNGDAAAKTVTVDVPGAKYGQIFNDITVVVPAGQIALIGPFPPDLANPSDGLVALTYSAVTSCTIGAAQF